MQISMHDKITEQEVIDLDKANTWSSAEKPRQRMAAPGNSHSLVTARAAGKLIGIGNAIPMDICVSIYRICSWLRCRKARASAEG